MAQDSISVCRSLKEFYDPMIRGYTGVQPPDVETAFDTYMRHYLQYDDYNFVEMCRSIGTRSPLRARGARVRHRATSQGRNRAL
jgi:hypothetical protein